MFSFVDLRDWAHELSREDAARAILALGVLWETRHVRRPSPATRERLIRDLAELVAHRKPVHLHFHRAIEWVRENASMVRPASDFALAWHEVEKEQVRQVLVEPRILPLYSVPWRHWLDPPVEEFLEFVWENRLGIDEFYFPLVGREPARTWDWPLRVSVPDSPAGERLESTIRRGDYTWVNELVRFVHPREQEVDVHFGDLRVLEQSLQGETGRVPFAKVFFLERETSLADTVDRLVSRPRDSGTESLLALMRPSRQAAVAAPEMTISTSWFAEFIRALSRNQPFASAIFTAGRKCQTPFTPFVFADPARFPYETLAEVAAPKIHSLFLDERAWLRPDLATAIQLQVPEGMPLPARFIGRQVLRPNLRRSRFLRRRIRRP